MNLPDDLAIEWDGQRYRPIATQKHVKLNGEEITLIAWDTVCPSCGSPFVVLTTSKFTGPRRRCDACKAPGRRVKSERRVRASDLAVSVDDDENPYA
jgi:transposase-like protein